jgi:hypothetical protein
MIIRYEGNDRYAMSGYELFWFAMMYLTLGWLMGNYFAQYAPLASMVFPEVVYGNK